MTYDSGLRKLEFETTPQHKFPYLVLLRKGFVVADARDWCAERFGDRDVWVDDNSRWTVFVVSKKGEFKYRFGFSEEDSAIEFKLRWG